jgi:hypothetical protein
MQPSLHLPEQTRGNLRPDVATTPARQSVGGFLQGLPCAFVGHRWVEASRTRRVNGRRTIRFKCSRCSVAAGFTN